MSPESQTPASEVAEEKPALPVSVKLKELSLTKVQLHVTVAPEHVSKAFRSVYRDLSRAGRIPGFRPGKAPREVLKRHYGDDAIKAQVIQDLGPQAYTAAVAQTGLRPLEQPDFEKVEVAEDGPLRLSTTIKVAPKLEPEHYKGLKLRRPVTDITDDDIDEEIEELRESTAGWADTDREEIRKGDLVIADVTIEVEGQEPVTLENEEYEVGEEERIPPVDRGFVGARVGQTLTIDTSYPDDYAEEELAGKDAKATAVLKGLREWRVPDVDDEFAKANYGFDTVAEMREDIRKNLAANAAKRAEDELHEQTFDALLEQIQVDVPDDLALAEAQERIASLEQSVRSRGLRFEEMLSANRFNREELLQAEMESARSSVAKVLLMDAVARAENIEASDEDVEAELKQIAERADEPIDEIRESWQTADRMDMLRHQVRTKKTLDFLIANAEIEDVPLDEYLAEKQGEQEEETAEDEEPEAASEDADESAEEAPPE